MSQNHLSNIGFICRYCGYRSGLNLRECPECGRVAAGASASENRPVESGEQGAAPPVYYKAPPAETRTIYICGACGYRTPNSLAECPECGRREFSETMLAQKRESSAARPPFDKEQAGKFLQYFGVGFFFIALLVFIGVGPTGKSYPRSGIVAAPGENLIGAFALFFAGVVIIFIGTYLKK